MFDKDVIHWMKKSRSDGTNTVSDFFEPLGRSSSFMPFSLVIGTYGIGAIIKDYKLKKASLLALESFAISGFFVQAIKFGVNRKRPEVGHRSFPSGHTAAVFAVASVFSYEYRDKKWLPPILYSVATITALSRINDLKHYPSDVVIGFAMGYFMGRHIAKIHDGPRKQNLTIVPAYFDKSPMIGLIYKFK
jgi:membrane-associated phospholipid phosphatase